MGAVLMRARSILRRRCAGTVPVVRLVGTAARVVLATVAAPGSPAVVFRLE
jgi:hypothetical protein